MTRENYMAACTRADTKMKETRGHQFVHILKTRCQRCGLSEKQGRGKCSGWFLTFIDTLYDELEGLRA